MGHHQVDKLERLVDRNTNERAKDKEEKDRKYDRERLIADSKDNVTSAYWCSKCKKDYQAPSRRFIETDWNTGDNIAYYVSHCPKRHINKRFITDRLFDPYYRSSRMLQVQRIDYQKDLIQPFQSGYNMLYGQSNNT
jgi:hypothetical protein